MAFRQVTMVEIREVLRQWLAGVGKKRIAARLGSIPRRCDATRVPGRRAARARRGEASLTDESFAAVVATLGIGMAAGHEHGDAWRRCEEQRTFIAGHLGRGVRLSKVRRLMQRQEERNDDDRSSIQPGVFVDVLRRLKLGRLLDTLPERFALARAQKMPHQDVLLLALGDEVSRRDSLAATVRAGRAGLEPDSVMERWHASSNVTLDQPLLNELVSLRFVQARTHVAIVGPVGVGKTFLAHALGNLACRRGHSVIAVRADKMLKSLRHARLDNSYETELRRLIAVDLLIVDDFGLDAMDPSESRDAYEILTERHRAGSIIVTSNRDPDEWLATFADPVRAQGPPSTASPATPTTSLSTARATVAGSSRHSRARRRTRTRLDRGGRTNQTARLHAKGTQGGMLLRNEGSQGRENRHLGGGLLLALGLEHRLRDSGVVVDDVAQARA